MTDAVAAVQARIAQIRSYTAPLATVSTTASTTSTAAASATSGSAFAAALAQVTGTGSTAGLADPATVPAGALSTTVTGQDLVESAKKYLGTPYVWGGETLAEGGLDCSGLVQLALGDLGITGVPRVARDQATIGQEVASLDEALLGDLVVLNGGKHIGIYVGDGQMIDAPKPGKAVTIRDVYAEPTTIRRILPQASATATSATSATSAALAATAAGQNALALLTGSTSSSSLPTTSSLWGATS
ncbi:C40 family peptidase [Cellulomonas sp. Marseille-Q8402]